MSGYPLAWPAGWPRSSSRKDAAFKSYSRRLSIEDGLKRLFYELERLGVGRDDVIVSTNVRPRLDGLPRSDGPAPMDPGVAVYWQKRRRDGAAVRRVMAIDRYNLVADNIAAIAATIESLRAIERHGGGQILERAFTGFTALPAPRSCWEILGLSPGAARETIESRFRELAKLMHPDTGGDAIRFSELAEARARAIHQEPEPE